MKKEKNPSKKAFNAAAFAQFFFGPGWEQAGTVLLVLRVPCNDGDRPKDRMEPGNQTQAPIGRVQTNNPRTDVIKAHRVGWPETAETREVSQTHDR